jgi:hypothetical protein
MYFAAAIQRKETAAAVSAGSPRRPRGVAALAASRAVGSFATAA